MKKNSLIVHYTKSINLGLINGGQIKNVFLEICCWISSCLKTIYGQEQLIHK